MTIEETGIEGLLLLIPRVFGDDRGYFMESFNQKLFEETTGLKTQFVQDNESKSSAGVVRGLHFQVPPKAQAKLVRVVQGEVLDVAVDLRKSSLTYGHVYSVVLSAENKKMLYIPQGFAHGFTALKPDTIFCYKCSDFYSHENERAIRFNDPDLKIDWGVDHPIVSPKDLEARLFADFKSPFE